MESPFRFDLVMILGLLVLVGVSFLAAPLLGLGGGVDVILAMVAALFAMFLTVAGLSRVLTGQWLTY